MSKFSCNTARLCAPLLVMCLLAAARGELTWAQDLPPDHNFFPIAHEMTFLPSQVLVRDMREDRDGNIWFASSAGPIRYDGKMFTDFGEEAGMAGRVLFSLTIDKSGALWFGSITGGASKYDGKSFKRFTTKEGLSGNHVTWILEDERGDIWFATGEGVSRYDGKTFTNYSTKDGLPHDSVNVITQDRSGKLWFGTQGGIAFYDGKTFTNFAGVAGREFTSIRSIVEDKAGNLWFGGQFGVYRYDGKTGTTLTAKDGLLEDFVGSMIVDKAGGVWFGHPQARSDTQGGATRYDGKTFTHFTQKEGLQNVYSMFEDREGRIWFGSVANFGTSRYDGKTFTNFSAPSPTNAELQLLQGTWEGAAVGDKAQQKITITVTGNSFHFHQDTNFWFDTTITLPAGTDPKQLHATIKDCPPSQASNIGQVVRAFFKIEDGTLTLAAIGGAEETPEGFEAAVESRYELRKVQPQKKMSGSGLGSLVLEGHELHASLRTREPDEPHRHLNPGLPPGNPHLSTDAAFVEAIARGASQGRLGREGIRSVLSAFYVDEKDLGFYGLEAESVEEANRREDVLREVWAHNARMGIARVHRAGLVLLVVWTDGVSPECWETVNAKVVERLSAP